MSNITFNSVSVINLSAKQLVKLEKLVKRINRMVGITTAASAAVCRVTTHEDNTVQVVINQCNQPDILFRLTNGDDLLIGVGPRQCEYIMCNGTLKRLLFQQAVTNFLAGVYPPAIAA